MGALPAAGAVGSCYRSMLPHSWLAALRLTAYKAKADNERISLISA